MSAASEAVRAAPAAGGRRFPFTAEGWPYLLVPLIPVAIAPDLAHAAPAPVFVASALGVIPTAVLTGRGSRDAGRWSCSVWPRPCRERC